MSRKLDAILERKVLVERLAAWFDKMQNKLAMVPSELNSQITLLSIIRSEFYEDINQHQHRAMILDALKILECKFVNSWTWHPEQSSDSDSADLKGYENGKVVLNAEVTTSLEPIGSIDKRMKQPLKAITKSKGTNSILYLTENMYNRAVIKRDKNSFYTTIRKIPEPILTSEPRMVGF